MCCPPRPCARRNLLRHQHMKRHRLHLIWSLTPPNQLPSSMDHHNGHAHRTRKGLPGRISFYSPMGHCAVSPGSPCIHKSAMARYGYSMPHGSAIVEHVRCASSVKNRRRPVMTLTIWVTIAWATPYHSISRDTESAADGDSCWVALFPAPCCLK